jgi:protocatechuate 3,4-dioxygenase alpha subunit
VRLEPTPSQTAGPFFSFSLCAQPASGLVAAGADGAIRLEGRVLDGNEEPVDDAMVEIWQADGDGRYGHWGRSGTDAEGRYAFTTVKPGADGSGQAPHVAMLVFARGLLKPVLTRVYFPDDEAANAEDPVLGAVSDPASLVARREDGAYRFDVRLQGDRQTTFFAL